MEQWLHDCSVVSEGNNPVITGELASWPSWPSSRADMNAMILEKREPKGGTETPTEVQVLEVWKCSSRCNGEHSPGTVPVPVQYTYRDRYYTYGEPR